MQLMLFDFHFDVINETFANTHIKPQYDSTHALSQVYKSFQIVVWEIKHSRADWEINSLA